LRAISKRLFLLAKQQEMHLPKVFARKESKKNDMKPTTSKMFSEETNDSLLVQPMAH